MGKFFKNKSRKTSDLYFFDVAVNVHGKIHTETYSISLLDLDDSIELGFLDGRTTYFDWNVLGTKKNFVGGLFLPSHYTFDEKYTYAHLEGSEIPSFRLPKYLFSRLSNKKEIFVGRREN